MAKPGGLSSLSPGGQQWTVAQRMGGAAGLEGVMRAFAVAVEVGGAEGDGQLS